MYEMEFTIKCHGHELQRVYRMIMNRYNRLYNLKNRDLYLEAEYKDICKLALLFKECLDKWSNEIGRL